MRLATAEQMSQTDRLAHEEFGLLPLVLMEEAGLATARVAAKLLQTKGKIVVLAGKGNNGGDGLVAARHLANWGGRVLVVLTERPEAGPALTNLEILEKMKLELIFARGKELRRIGALLQAADLVVDALLGTGLTGPPKGLARELILALRRREGPILSVDLPSGINSEGQIFQPHLEATATITFAAPKLAHFLYPARAKVGQLYFTDLGIPQSLIKNICTAAQLLDRTILKKLPPRDPITHKGTAGKVLLVAGSPGLIGAAALAAEGALRSGAGLVRVVTSGAAAGVLASKLTEAMVEGIPQNPKLLGPESLPRILELAASCDAVAVGPGLGRGQGPKQLVAELLANCEKPLLLDADALFALSELKEIKRSQPLILTPHAGEMARLVGITSNQVDGRRLYWARELAKKWESIVVLKGPGTVITAAGQIPYLNSTGNAAMATGGMGDLLTGIILALVPQMKSEFEAAALGVWVHGLAGDLAALEFKASRGLVASDLLPFIPRILAGVSVERKPILFLDRLGKEGNE